MYVILRMCTSHRRTVELVAGETRKNFCTSLSEMKNESALNYKNIKMNWFTNDENLFERAVSVKSLKKAWFTLKSKLNVLNKKRNNIILEGVDNFWFTQTSKELLEGSFEYLDKKNIFVGAVESRYFSSMIAYWKMKIIEKALFNALEPQFEGYFSWKNLAKKEYLVAISKNANNSYYKKTIIGNKILYFKKKIICLPVFYVCSYGSRPKKSVHQALIAIKHWRKDSIFWINYNVSKVFNKTNYKQLKIFFKKKIKDSRFWCEISKILHFETIHDCATMKVKYVFWTKKTIQKNILGPLLFNIYMHELDEKLVNFQKFTKKIYGQNKHAVYRNNKIKKYCDETNYGFPIENLKKTWENYCFKKTFVQIRKTVLKKPGAKQDYQKNLDFKGKFIEYIRYVNVFLIGITGNREFALQIRKDLNGFIENSLYLEIKNDNLIDCNENSVEFLGHFISLGYYKEKVNRGLKNSNTTMLNKNKFICRFLENDKRLAKAKSYQFYSNVLKQLEVFSSKFKDCIKKKSRDKILSSIIAYKFLGFQLMKTLSLNNWEQFNELSSSIEFDKLFSKKKDNPALRRWSLYLQIESNKLNEFNAKILHNKITSVVTFDWYESLSKGEADKIKHLQENYLFKSKKIIKEFWNFGIEKKRNKIVFEFKNNLSKKKRIFSELLTKKISRTIVINAPVDEVFARLRLSGYLHPTRNRSVSNPHLNFYTDFKILSHFNSIICGLLNGYSGADNFVKIKSLTQLLRFSCVLTLANKHKKPKNWVYKAYGNRITVFDGKKKNELISKLSIFNHVNNFNLKINSLSIDNYGLDKMITRFDILNDKIKFLGGCAVTNCLEFENIEVYYARHLHRKINKNGIVSIVDIKDDRVVGLSAILASINRKQIPLCRKHCLKFESGLFFPLNFSKLNKTLSNITKPKQGDFKSIFNGEDHVIDKKENK